MQNVGIIPFIPFLNGVSTMTLVFGDGKKTGKQAQVIQLQKVLQTLGFSPGVIDGEYGQKTASAVANFQNTYGINPTGTLDETTFTRMKSAIAGNVIARKVVAPTELVLEPSPGFLGISTTYWLVGIGAITLWLMLRK